MHRSSLLRMEWFTQTFLSSRDHKIRVLDVGSCGVNGTYRAHFRDSRFDYVGLDVEPGPNVDFVPRSPYSLEGNRR